MSSRDFRFGMIRSIRNNTGSMYPPPSVCGKLVSTIDSGADSGSDGNLRGKGSGDHRRTYTDERFLCQFDRVLDRMHNSNREIAKHAQKASTLMTLCRRSAFLVSVGSSSGGPVVVYRCGVRGKTRV